MKKRAKHSLSHYTLRTTNLGILTPLTAYPVLPGDTVQHATSCLIRVSPLNTPVMHPVTVRIHHWYVPNRIVNANWEDFITGGEDGNQAPPLPTIGSSTNKKNTYSYMFGTPPFSGISYNAMPNEAYLKIYNERYRDQDLSPKVSGTSGLQTIAWEKDYFTTARPFSAKGPAITIPIGQSAPVATTGNTGGSQLEVKRGLGGADSLIDSSGASAILGGTGPSGDGRLVADLSSTTGVDINTFRAGFALQRYQEARARYGARFVEYLRYLGIQPSDARLQEPEYLGGGSTRLNFSEVLQTTPASQEGTAGVGDLYGHGIAAVRSNAFRKFFEEHGYVITLLSVRPKSLYLNGVHRELQKKTKEDYFQKELSNLGMQEVWKSELYGEDAQNVFGWQDRYHEYRHHPSSVAGDFRDTLKSWHFGRDLPNDVELNDSFVKCDPSDSPFQVPPGTADTLWCMANHKVVARRMVPKRSNPRIL